MKEQKLANVACELEEIFKYLEKDVLEKIPQELKEQISKRKNPEYKFELDKSKELKEQDLMEETKQMLSVIFLKYCCTEEEAEEILEKHEMLKIEKENEKVGLEELQDIFNSNLKNSEPESLQNQMVSIEEFTWYGKLVDKIKSFFKIKK